VKCVDGGRVFGMEDDGGRERVGVPVRVDSGVMGWAGSGGCEDGGG